MTVAGAIRRPIVIAVANQKGGVGKTTTAVSLSAGLAIAGVRTTLIDLDGQGSASATFRWTDPPDGPRNAAALFARELPLAEAAVATHVADLWLVPADEQLVGLDAKLASAFGRERILARCIAASRDPQLEAVVIDTAPYLGLITLNALIAADYVVVPVSCEYLPMLGLRLLHRTLDDVRRRWGARAEVLGYLLTMYDRREAITLEVEGILRRTFGELVFAQPARVDTRHKASPSHKQTIFEFEPESGRGRSDYAALVEEVLRRLRLRGHHLGAPPPPTFG
ncbi:MAG: ParA family protein [Deltaproteobacteria bacterium]|nr:ParA family protein [Deltaproteobacteria bacterium]